jgi:hypothetical protein
MTEHTRKHLKQRALTYREKAMLRLALDTRAAQLEGEGLAPALNEYRYLTALLQRSQIIVKTTGDIQ